MALLDTDLQILNYPPHVYPHPEKGRAPKPELMYIPPSQTLAEAQKYQITILTKELI